MAKTNHIPVLIVGGGPTGLFLALSLSNLGIDCRVIEKNEAPTQHSRSIGIHPPSLELFDRLGLVKPFLQEGILIRKGHAYLNQSWIGMVGFDSLPAPHQYVLSLPQSQTETILEAACQEVDSSMVRRGVTLTSYETTQDGVRVHMQAAHGAKSTDGDVEEATCDILVGCDGKRSVVRELAGIAFNGSHYPDTYMMGDFEDTTPFGEDAMITLHQDGLVECFPLAKGRRRWVVKTAQYVDAPTEQELKEIVAHRTGFDLRQAQCTMTSSFGVQHYIAETFAKGRVVLAGDAAHVVSPIGGQGMNLGWLDGEALAKALHAFLSTQNERHLQDYSKRQRSIARQAGKRAEWNMRLGRSFKNRWVKRWMLYLFVRTSIQRVLAQLFTMQKLGAWRV
ncbi:MAG: FAD-dependent monooxygenase [Rhodothermaceae bacterium TMED105]|nr:MAG: FAD-dependent monooxygenase [Rhodothermaceae bacterium TMED105]